MASFSPETIMMLRTLECSTEKVDVEDEDLSCSQLSSQESSEVDEDSSSSSSESSSESRVSRGRSVHGGSSQEEEFLPGGLVLASKSKKKASLEESMMLKELAQNETKAVERWRRIVMIMLILTGATLAALTYVLFTQKETTYFQETYYLFASRIADASVLKGNDFRLGLGKLSEDVTATASAMHEEFPFVTIPKFEQIASQARTRSSVERIVLSFLVTDSDRTEWETYTLAHQGWIEESQEIAQQQRALSYQGRRSLQAANDTGFDIGAVDSHILPLVWERNASYSVVESPQPGPYSPAWQTSPAPSEDTIVNYNFMAENYMADALESLSILRVPVFTAVVDMYWLVPSTLKDHAFQQFQAGGGLLSRASVERPQSSYLVPIFSKLRNRASDIVGFVNAVVPWDGYINNIVSLVPDEIGGILFVLKNTCGQTFSYELASGDKVTYLGERDYHESRYSSMEVVIPLSSKTLNQTTTDEGDHCIYSLSVYPSDSFETSITSNTAVVLTVTVASIFFVVLLTFFMYESYVQSRNVKIVGTATKATKLLSSLFPSNVRDRLLAENMERENNFAQPARARLSNFLKEGGGGNGMGEQSNEPDDDNLIQKSKPIADLFPDTTIMFGDIAGFTAWSSEREPTQVFILLETLYRAFDEIAKRRRVFKVETVADCYVAVAGLPDPRPDHAVVMARFARDCMEKMQELVRKLEVQLGPDTGDLAMRIGLHSGPVTAGVLRGERSRFQLFGDSMNTASRIETTGVRDKIHLSAETKDQLAAAGKGHWVTMREDKVYAKGKGEMQTYWLNIAKQGPVKRDTDVSETSADSHSTSSKDAPLMATSAQSTRISRLIDWNVEVLANLLRQIGMRRQTDAASGVRGLRSSKLKQEADPVGSMEMTRFHGPDQTVIDEVKEIIALPDFDSSAAPHPDGRVVELDSAVEAQLYDYVSSIAALYRDNPFHNFEHASHVTMSVVKLLSRIVAPDIQVDPDLDKGKGRKSTLASTLQVLMHDHTYGITSDPLTQFSCVLAALIHDVDHPGVSNSQLVKEGAPMAVVYKSKSVAEQNSIDLAWDLLMQEEYVELRGAIFSTDSEMNRFRQLIVNAVMATDIMDKDLKAARNARWETAFQEAPDALDRDNINRKATIVIEHLIQASDVAHTMQHWHVYRKWNQRFFEECYQAFKDGRAEADPTDNWYKGELGFFDFYIIPLAKKLKECGVFGVSSEEYLTYATRNRQEWEMKGEEIVNEMKERIVNAS